MRSQLLWILFGSLILIGCEGAPVPLGEPDPALFDETALGSWISQGSTDRMHLRIFRYNEAEYYAEARLEDDEPDEWMRLRIYPTELEGVMFANIQCVGCDERDWFFYAYEMRGDSLLSATALADDFYEDDAADVTSTTALRSAASSRIADGNLFVDTRTYVRWLDDPERR